MAASSPSQRPPRRILIGVGGASNSGKTTLSKILFRLFKETATPTTLIHLDDFAPPMDKVPYSPEHPDLQDWDTPATAIDWPACRAALAHWHSTGKMPEAHQSHDHLNKSDGLQIPDELEQRSREIVREVVEKAEKDAATSGPLEIALLDGFLNYWDPQVLAQIDVCLFLRVPYALLKARREARQVYVTQSQQHASAGAVWTDPPHYFDNIVYPAYVLAHTHIFTTPSTSHLPPTERVEHSPPSAEWTTEAENPLVVLVPREGAEGMGETAVLGLEAVRGRI